jgi:hypothetical protein
MALAASKASSLASEQQLVRLHHLAGEGGDAQSVRSTQAACRTERDHREGVAEPYSWRQSDRLQLRYLLRHGMCVEETCVREHDHHVCVIEEVERSGDAEPVDGHFHATQTSLCSRVIFTRSFTRSLPGHSR